MLQRRFFNRKRATICDNINYRTQTSGANPYHQSTHKKNINEKLYLKMCIVGAREKKSHTNDDNIQK